MILGVEHIALSCATIDEATGVLEERGFKRSFVERRLPNAPAKKPLLREWLPVHDIASFRGPLGIAVEAVAHGNNPTIGGPGFDVPGWGTDAGAIANLRIDVDDVAVSVRFWNALGFRCADLSQPQRLRLRAPVPAWSLDLELRLKVPARRTWLDDAGFPCLALVTNRLSQDLGRASECGARDVTAPFMAEVAGRSLTIALCRAPSGQLVEFVELNKAN
jgi:hypothetical protein